MAELGSFGRYEVVEIYFWFWFSAVIGQLRGVTKTGQLADYLRRQVASEEVITRITGEAAKPWE